MATLNFKFDIIALSETKLQNEPSANVTIEGYNTLINNYTEANKGGVCIYIAENLNFKLRNGLNIYESKELESVFIEIDNGKVTNDIVGVIYRHPSMQMDIFNEDKFELLLSKLNRENNKYIYIPGDVNFDLLKVNIHEETSIFFNKMMSNLLLPAITIPTKMNTVNDILIDNIFSNNFNSDMISVNFVIDISDHLPSFLIVPNKNDIQISKNHNIYTRDFDKLDKENFMLDLLDLNDDTSSNPHANDAFNELYEVTNEVIERHIPAHKLTNKEFKRRHKRWITSAILNSIGRKNKLYKKYIKCKNTVTRNQIFQEYKTLKNQITQIIRVNKKQHFARYFSANNNNLRKLWDGIKELVNIKP